MVAPEILLGSTQFSTVVDMWSVGCVMIEILTRELLFDRNTKVSQIYQVFSMLGGIPNDTIWREFFSISKGEQGEFLKTIQPK
uniref:Protein kinase domain-containing protein n=1 Tax=Solanum lycopersicum TaxID=4081 RepID=A0A3Q7G0S1_SOLLC